MYLHKVCVLAAAVESHKMYAIVVRRACNEVIDGGNPFLSLAFSSQLDRRAIECAQRWRCSLSCVCTICVIWNDGECLVQTSLGRVSWRQGQLASMKCARKREEASSARCRHEPSKKLRCRCSSRKCRCGLHGRTWPNVGCNDVKQSRQRHRCSGKGDRVLETRWWQTWRWSRLAIVVGLSLWSGRSLQNCKHCWKRCRRSGLPARGKYTT